MTLTEDDRVKIREIVAQQLAIFEFEKAKVRLQEKMTEIQIDIKSMQDHLTLLGETEAAHIVRKDIENRIEEYRKSKSKYNEIETRINKLRNYTI